MDSRMQSVVATNPSSEAAQTFYANFYHFQGLRAAVGGSFHHGCGSYMIDGQTYTYTDIMFKKQEALFEAGKQATNALEVGVYLGHSLLILLLSNPTLQITAIDNDSAFTPRAVAYLNQHFGNRIKLIVGDADAVLLSLPLKSFNLIHIDADHSIEAVTSNFRFCKRLAAPNAQIIFDDYDATKDIIDSWIEANVLKKICIPDCVYRNCITQLL